MIKRTLGLIFLICGVIGCTPRESAVEAGIRTQTLHIGNNAEPPDLDPHTNNSLIGGFIGSALHEGLVSLANDGTTIKPGVAERWEISDNGLRYTFHLRDDAKWSNGDPITSADFVAGFHRLTNPVLGAEGAVDTFPIVGARDFAEGRNPDFSSVGVSAPDDHTVEIRLEFPAPYFLAALAIPRFAALHGPMLDQFGGWEKRGGKWTSPGNYISNGPFILKAWSPNVSVVLAKNPHYWNHAAVGLQEIHFHPIEDGGAEERAFRSGQLHITFGLPTSKLEVYRDDAAPELLSYSILRSNFLAFNTAEAPFDDARVRRAFSLSIDRDRLVTSILAGQGVAASSMTPPETGDYNLPPFTSYDPAAAQQLLAEAGYPAGAGFPAIEFTLSSRDEAMLTYAQAVQQMWKHTLGVEVQLAPTEFKVWLDQLLSKSLTLTTCGWNLLVDDPTDLLSHGLSDSPHNTMNWVSPRFDAAFNAIKHAPDNQARRQAILECERLIADEAPWAPVFFSIRNQLVHTAVRGWRGNRMQAIDWTAISLQAE